MADAIDLPSRPPALESRGGLDGASIGRRRFIAGAGALAGAAAVGQLVPAGSVSAALPAGASKFAILPSAIRLADTREPWNYEYLTVGDGYIRVKVGGRNGVPATATAAVLTVTSVNFGSPNHVTCWPTGVARPVVSSLNLDPWTNSANMVTLKLGADGSIDVQSLVSAHLIVDVLGYYEPVADASKEGRYIGLPTPLRAYDSRPAMPGNESYTTVDLTAYVPPDATSVVINLTAAGSTAAGHFTAMPYDLAGPPKTSSLNVSGPGENRAAGVTVPVTTDGGGRRRIKIYAHRAAFIIVDVFGYYTGPSSSLSQVGLFVPLTPERIMDTRLPGQIGRMWPGWVVEVPIPAAIDGVAAAVACNVTGVQSRAAGHLVVSAARQPVPDSSNVNWSKANAVVPNHVITQVTKQYGLQVFNAFGSHVLVDLAGYFTGTPKLPSVIHTNPPPPAAPPNWILRVPRLGLTSTVMAGNAKTITDSGHTWHWTGTGYMGQAAHVAVFGHRTEAGGPYRYIDNMQNGDLITVTTGDGREYTYRMVGRYLTDAATTNILNATRANAGTTFSIVACTVGHDRTKSGWPNIWAPTSLKYRIVVNFELVSWREI
ncbi:MAG: sortase [Ilumatobacter sp.]|nr:sortase [Ilumatobacter sp.]